MVKTRSCCKVAEVALSNGHFHMEWTLKDRALAVDREWIDRRVKGEASIIEDKGMLEVGRCSRKESDRLKARRRWREGIMWQEQRWSAVGGGVGQGKKKIKTVGHALNVQPSNVSPAGSALARVGIGGKWNAL